LNRFRDGRVKAITTQDGLPDNLLLGLLEDGEGNLWFSSNQSVFRLALKELNDFADGKISFLSPVSYGAAEGMRSTESNGGSPGGWITRDGRIWFPTLRGVVVIDPTAGNRFPPPVVLEEAWANKLPLAGKGRTSVPPGNNTFDFRFTALSFSAPEKLHFKYRLEPFDKDWVDARTHHTAHYTNMDPGEYSFHVLAANNFGIWSGQEASVRFLLQPHFYQTNWFRALCAASILILLWGGHQFRVRQLAHQFNMRLEERVAERTRVARDLHDTLLQSFQALLPSLQAGINMLAARPADARKVLEDTADHASQAIAEGRDAVQGLRMSTVEKNDLAVAIRTVGEELASAASTQPSPNFNVVVEGASRNLHPILRDEVYRLAVEALRNAFRHAAAQNVEVEIRYDDKDFRLRVRDDGKGIPSDVLGGDGREGHYGLPGMRERAKLVGGKLAIWTELDGGTEIELNIPGARAYVKSTRTFWHFGKRSATDTDEKEPIERE
jgi:signal transduction histidine kinase